jgi:hypothetical protein
MSATLFRKLALKKDNDVYGKRSPDGRLASLIRIYDDPIVMCYWSEDHQSRIEGSRLKEMPAGLLLVQWLLSSLRGAAGDSQE